MLVVFAEIGYAVSIDRDMSATGLYSNPKANIEQLSISSNTITEDATIYILSQSVSLN